MIVGSLLLILVAVVLLVLGLVEGSSLLLIASIAASLLAAVALVVGARQAAAARAAADPTSGPDLRSARRRREPAGAPGPLRAEPGIPQQHIPTTADVDDSGWRQPPGSPVTGPDAEAVGADRRPDHLGTADPLSDEPGTQDVPPANAALIARLRTEVLVVDGRPRYHVAACPHLVGRDAEPVPVAEAVELGFTPCASCAPDTVLLTDSRPR